MTGWLKAMCVAACVMAFASPARATWSITAVDEATGEVGAAGASCTNYVYGIVGVVPGHGVVVAQALSNMDAKRRAMRMLAEGASPKLIIETVTNPAFDVTYRGQQYGVAALGFPAAAYTGEATMNVNLHVTGPAYTVQGNILPGAGVARDAAAAYDRTRGRLSKRLMAALEAGAASGGDQRCGAQRARSAFVVVARRGDTRGKFSLDIKVVNEPQSGRNAVSLLRQRYDTLAR